MSYIRYIEPTYYYDNPTVGFTTGSATYVLADENITMMIAEGNYLFDYTLKGASSAINRLVYFKVSINGIVIDEWQKESKDIGDMYPLTGVSKNIVLATGAQTVTVDVKADSPADVTVDSFRFTLKKWG